jgi:hypothetical protein
LNVCLFRSIPLKNDKISLLSPNSIINDSEKSYENFTILKFL